MRILYIIPYVPSQIYVRPYQIIRHMAARGHQISVVTLWVNEADREAIQQLENEGIDVFSTAQPKLRSLLNSAKVLPGKIPLQAVYSWQPALAEKIQRLLLNGNGKPGFDIVHIEHLRGSRYGQFVQNLRNEGKAENKLKHVAIIWDSVDSITHLFRQASNTSSKLTSRIITRLELPRTEAYERLMVQTFDKTLVTSPIDRQAFIEIIANPALEDKIEILPNGVDLTYFTPPEGTKRESATIVVSGKMSYHANVTMVMHLVHQIMPAVWQIRPDVKLWIVGKDPGKEIRLLAERPGITVTGTVADIRPYLQNATVAVAPIQYGAGIQNKVLQAMACGTPVVCSPLAVSALFTTHEKNILVAENPSDFASAILNLVNNVEYASKIGATGRKYVETYHDWHRIAEKLENIYATTIQSLINKD
jgi:polysaccharide biosynthesis protein PslH